MTAFDLVMFDLDGTLVETAPEIMDAVNDALGRFGLPEVDQEHVNDWIGYGTRELMIKALALITGFAPEAVRDSALLAQIMPVYNMYYNRRCGTRSRLYPRVREVLERLRSDAVKLAVVTNKEARYTQVVMDVHQITDLFDVVISGDTLPVKKPNPAAVAHCLDKFAISPQRALFVGDSSIDAATARAAGVQIWLLPYGYNMGEAVQACSPDRVIADFSALLEA